METRSIVTICIYCGGALGLCACSGKTYQSDIEIYTPKQTVSTNHASNSHPNNESYPISSFSDNKPFESYHGDTSLITDNPPKLYEPVTGENYLTYIHESETDPTYQGHIYYGSESKPLNKEEFENLALGIQTLYRMGLTEVRNDVVYITYIIDVDQMRTFNNHVIGGTDQLLETHKEAFKKLLKDTLIQDVRIRRVIVIDETDDFEAPLGQNPNFPDSTGVFPLTPSFLNGIDTYLPEHDPNSYSISFLHEEMHFILGLPDDYLHVWWSQFNTDQDHPLVRLFGNNEVFNEYQIDRININAQNFPYPSNHIPFRSDIMGVTDDIYGLNLSNQLWINFMVRHGFLNSQYNVDPRLEVARPAWQYFNGNLMDQYQFSFGQQYSGSNLIIYRTEFKEGEVNPYHEENMQLTSQPVFSGVVDHKGRTAAINSDLLFTQIPGVQRNGIQTGEGNIFMVILPPNVLTIEQAISENTPYSVVQLDARHILAPSLHPLFENQSGIQIVLNPISSSLTLDEVLHRHDYSIKYGTINAATEYCTYLTNGSEYGNTQQSNTLNSLVRNSDPVTFAQKTPQLLSRLLETGNILWDWGTQGNYLRSESPTINEYLELLQTGNRRQRRYAYRELKRYV